MLSSSAGSVLVADDEETFRTSTADLLRGQGFEVMTARCASEARDLLPACDPDVIIADIRMEGNDALQLIGELQASPVAPPVILVTGYPSLETAVPAVTLPVSAYLTKPFSFDDLLPHVRAAVDQHRTQRALHEVLRRAEEWQRDLALVRSAAGTTSSLSAFAALAISNITRSLDDLRRIVNRKDSGTEQAPFACVAMNCQRHAFLSDELAHAVEVLEATRHAFKSKQLGELRVRLEGALAVSRAQQ